jgi:3-methyladenine DNA glycosylase AlkD
MNPDVARDLERRMRRIADPDRARSLQWFFKTGRGEYGEGDRVLGLTVPQVRRLAKDYMDVPLDQVAGLLESRWHEIRMLALVLLTARYRDADEAERAKIYRLYLRRTDRINNWDLVDVSAPRIVGAHLATRPRAILRRLARSASVWERRIAVLATLAFISRGEFDDTLELATLLLDDPHDLMHKAVGWMLREVGKRDERVLCRYLDRHASRMPRTALRYAVERLSPARRTRYMSLRSSAATRTSRSGSAPGRD